MDPLEPILAEIIKGYQTLSGCRAIALVGSRARGTAKPFSNVDLITIFYSAPSDRERSIVIKRLQDKDSTPKMYQHPIMTDSFKRGGLQIKIWHISQDMICERVATVEKRLRLVSPMLIASLFESKILWDQKNQLQAWKNRIRPLPEEYKQTVIPLIYGEVSAVIEDLSQEIDTRNFFFVQHELIDALENLYELIFLLNGQYLNLSPRIESMMSGFTQIPKGFQKKVTKLLSAPCTAQGLRQKWRLLSELAKNTGDFILSKGYIQIAPFMEILKSSAPFLFKNLENQDTGKLTKSSKRKPKKHM
jgi:Nucleotidyltransferase domain